MTPAHSQTTYTASGIEMRSWLRRRLFNFVRRIFEAEDGRDILADALSGRISGSGSFRPANELLYESPYADLSLPSEPLIDGDGAIFITGRFRSGSTLLWNIFRHAHGCTAYYEPLNERRWFDPSTRGKHTDKTHLRVENYWREYEGIEELANYYCEDWIRRDLFMAAESWQPKLRRYIEILLERAAGRAVLQFNRVDFRLPWLKAQFPKVKIVHLYRHPRDQWLSTLHGGQFPLDGSVADFERDDKFYLLTWARDLRHHFPFLNALHLTHPYELFYLIWKLSFLFGRQYANVSVAYEQLINDPTNELARLFESLEMNDSMNDSLLSLIEKGKAGRWSEYANDAWFTAREHRCERILATYFRVGMQFAATPICLADVQA